jgi:hypothetical protein
MLRLEMICTVSSVLALVLLVLVAVISLYDGCHQLGRVHYQPFYSLYSHSFTRYLLKVGGHLIF